MQEIDDPFDEDDGDMTDTRLESPDTGSDLSAETRMDTDSIEDEATDQDPEGPRMDGTELSTDRRAPEPDIPEDVPDRADIDPRTGLEEEMTVDAPIDTDPFDDPLTEDDGPAGGSGIQD